MTDDDLNPGLTNRAVNKLLMSELVKGKRFNNEKEYKN